jgi:hypothetical protein
MKDFTAELEQVFGVAPSGETGLLIDTFDGAGIGGEVRACGTTRADAAAFSICFATFGDPSVSPCRVGWCGNTHVVVPA